MNRTLTVLAVLLALGIARVPVEAASPFQKAQPVWPKGRSLEKNLTVGFRALLDLGDPRDVRLRLTASTCYRATVNGSFVGYGPARGPHGWYRVDEVDLSPWIQPGANIVAIEVAGYNVNSYYTLDQPSFLQAEILVKNRVLSATGNRGFTAFIPGERLQKVQRYSFQRPFTEVYRIRKDHDRWKRDVDLRLQGLECAPDGVLRAYLPRRVPWPDFKLRRPVQILGSGRVVPRETVPRLWKDRSLTQIGPKLEGFPEAELEVIPSIRMQKVTYRPEEDLPADGTAVPESLPVPASTYALLDLGTNLTGFAGVTVECKEPSRLVLAFDEVLRDGLVDFKRLGCVNLIVYELPTGTYRLESFEPYTFRYLQPVVLEGKCRLSDIYLREYVCSGVNRARFRSSDPRLDKLFEAGRETFRQNTLDTFMDCPSRERAGWLCDSFFTARAALDLRGDTIIEQTMMENFLLPEKFEFLPEGMLPMCYPADHNDGVFIPNWALWLVIQLEEYVDRSGDTDTAEGLKPKVLGLIEFLRGFRNDDGLLEKLPSWVFIEWSDANKYVQDVNYPSNMLYAAALSVAGKLYGLKELTTEAEQVRETIRKQSFDGTFFVDNAVRTAAGKLEVTRNRTEVCQYYAFFFDVATPKSHPELWATLRDRFGPRRKDRNDFPEVGLANSFIGNMLRIELLSHAGLSRQILDESIDYLLYMAERTGTLWEHTGDFASCNHGFASHIVRTLYRDVLGLRKIDLLAKEVEIRFAPLDLESCEGERPTPDGTVYLRWRKKGDSLEYSVSVPEDYELHVENSSGLELRRVAGGDSGTPEDG